MGGTPAEYTDHSATTFIKNTQVGEHSYSDGALDNARAGAWNGSKDHPAYSIYAPLEPPGAIPAAKPGVSDDARFAKLDAYVKEQRNQFNTPPEELESRVANAMGLKSVKDLPPDVKKRIDDDCSPPSLPKVELHNPSPEALAARDAFSKSIDADHRYDGMRNWVKNVLDSAPKGTHLEPEQMIKVLQGNRQLSPEERYAVFSACGKPNDFYMNDPEGQKLEQKFETKNGH